MSKQTNQENEMTAEPRAALRTNVHEDRSQTFDVLLNDGIDGNNQIEISAENRQDADYLLAILHRAGFETDSFCDRCY
jgi:hypothetical protein